MIHTQFVLHYVDAWSVLIIVAVGHLGLTFVNISNLASFGKLASQPQPLREEVTLSASISRCQWVRYQVVIIDREGSVSLLWHTL